jgi:ketosteroid isomerase-like protein
VNTLETVQRFLQSVGAQDLAAIQDCFAHQVDWNVPGTPSLPWIGRRSTKPEVGDYFTTMWSHFNQEKAEVEIKKVLVDGDDAVIVGRFGQEVAASCRSFSTDIAMHLSVRDGKIVQLHLYEDTLAVSQAFS